MDPTVVVIVVAVVLAVAVGGWLFFRGRKPKEESFYHFRCVKCKRRLRYLERQVGHKGKCSNCGSEVLFPPVSQAVD
jgi:DNA-directed RNA polymerase subunit RPC12/RpoP